jgi:uncharacterized protein (DUF2249 family)
MKQIFFYSILITLMSCTDNKANQELNIPEHITKFKFETIGSLDGGNKKLVIQENDTIYSVELSGSNYEYLEFYDIDNGDRYVHLQSDKSKQTPSMVISSSEGDETKLPTAVFQMIENEDGISFELPYEISIGDSILKLDMSSLSKDSENKMLLYKT